MTRSLSLKAIAELTQAKLAGDESLIITHVADLDSASFSDISFLSNPRYEQSMLRSSAGACFVPLNFAPQEGKNLLFVENPSLAFQKMIQFFFEGQDTLTGFDKIHPTAVIHPTVKLGKNIQIGPYVVIDKEVTIGDETVILAHVSIGPSVAIGSKCLLHAHVTIRESSTIGNRVIIQPGAVIGSCGFGYITDAAGNHLKLEQLGTVTIEDDVEIGANTTIDRSRFKTTCIGRGSKIDNLVQIGHGVCIGKGNIIVAQAGIAGSSKTGNYVVIGGQVGVSGHIEIEDGVQIAAKSGISKSLNKKAEKYGGVPAIPLREHQKNSVHLKNIERYVDQIKELEARLAALESRG